MAGVRVTIVGLVQGMRQLECLDTFMNEPRWGRTPRAGERTSRQQVGFAPLVPTHDTHRLTTKVKSPSILGSTGGTITVLTEDQIKRGTTSLLHLMPSCDSLPLIVRL